MTNKRSRHSRGASLPGRKGNVVNDDVLGEDVFWEEDAPMDTAENEEESGEEETTEDKRLRLGTEASNSNNFSVTPRVVLGPHRERQEFVLNCTTVQNAQRHTCMPRCGILALKIVTTADVPENHLEQMESAFVSHAMHVHC